MSEGHALPRASTPSSLHKIKALTFDVFGTTVNWRASIESALTSALDAKMNSAGFATLPAELQARARNLQTGGVRDSIDIIAASAWPSSFPTPDLLPDWPCAFAAAWRRSYGRFTRGFEPGITPWKDIDTHHRESLERLLEERGLAGLFTDDEVLELSRAWHRLEPWPDTRQGLARLASRGLVTAALSNGNQSLLQDLNTYHDGLGFDRLFSAEDFGAYKPNPRTYLGAVEGLGLRPDEVAMVAAHLGDLKGAKACGLRTVYLERVGEEEWIRSEERYEDARRWVDIWITLGGDQEGGFVELAKQLPRRHGEDESKAAQ
ncbi:haloacid dehalogenase [Pyricularia oryzae]|uniref:Haloacid dehalogenase n=2 Tax=Pyricularia oryzae TaxID=318829 RepID=A0AA97NUT4_PYRO3|nr:haloacid dehalogenase [Pyricularia oryzae Y34]KAI7924728.1 haloacid dehalogenase [Pyricularia oryzae]KAI7928080.1 haloacid dehalogenase [Pyricularia oryzae]